MPKLVEIGINALFAALRENEHKALVDLMVSLLRRNAYSLDEFVEGVRSKTDQLEDLRFECCFSFVPASSLCAQALDLRRPFGLAKPSIIAF